METEEKFMRRCFQLATKGAGYTDPNPMVGAVIVHKNKIIGEGWHRRYGEAHAEVNAINTVKNLDLFIDSTLYVSLEPCSHFGKTPPCAALIIEKKIPRVVIAMKDPNPKVSGRGIGMLRDAGVEVEVGVLHDEAEELNRMFVVNQKYNRPYVILKWAQSADGFIDRIRGFNDKDIPPVQLSNEITQSVVHKFRTRVNGIMVGTHTAMKDQPRLTARKWFGKNPTRIVLDRSAKLSAANSIFDNLANVVVFTESCEYPIKKPHVAIEEIDFNEQLLLNMLKKLYKRGIFSLLVEGGSILLSDFIGKNIWDESVIETTTKRIKNGVKSPKIEGLEVNSGNYLDSRQIHLKNKISRKFL